MAEDLKTKVLIGGDISGLTAAFGEAATAVKEGSAAITEGFGSIGEAIEGVQSKFIAFAAGAGAIAGFAEFVHATREASDSTRNLSLAMGTSLESASVLRSALAGIGASSEQYVGALDHLARQLRRNEDGIQSLGIATRNADGSTRDSQAVMQDALRVVQEYKPGLDQTQAAMYLFGRSVEEVRQLMPLLNVNMDEAKEKAQALGLILSGEQVAAVNRYKVSLNESKEVVEGAFNSIGQQLIPVLTSLQQRFVEAGPAIVEFAKGVGDFLVGAIRVAVSAVQEFIGVLQTWKVALGTVGIIIGDALTGHWSDIKSDWKVGMSELDEVSRTTAARIKATWTDAQASVGKAVDPLAVGNKGSKGWTEPLKAAAAERDAVLRAQLAGEIAIVREYDTEQERELKRSLGDGLISIKDYYAQGLTLVQQTIDTEIAANQRLQQAVAAQKSQAAAAHDDKGVQTAMAEQIKLENELIVLQQKRAAAAVQSAEEEADAERAVTAKIEAAKLASHKKIADDALDAQKAIIEAEAKAGQISGVQAIAAFREIEKSKYDIAVEYATKRAALEKDQVTAQQELQSQLATIYADYQKKDTEIAVENVKQRKDFETQALQDMQNDFATALGQIEDGHKKLYDVILGFFNSLTTQMEKLANEEIAQSLFGANPTAGSAGSSGGGGWFSQIFGSIGGGSPGSAPDAQSAASGIMGLGNFLGFLDTGMRYVPHTGLAVLHPGERVLTRQENLEGGSGDTIHVHNNFNVSGEMTYESRAAIASQVGRSLTAARRNW